MTGGACTRVRVSSDFFEIYNIVGNGTLYYEVYEVL